MDSIIAGTSADTMPPLSYFLLHFWMKLNQSIGFIRMLNITLNLLVMILVYKFGQDLAGNRTGLFAAFLVAISPFQIYHAQEIRMYILLELGCLGYLWQVWRFGKIGKLTTSGWIALTVFGWVALYSHNLAVFTLLVADVFFILRKEWRSLGKLILSQIVLVAGFLPWLFLVPGQIGKIQTAFWTHKPGIVEVIQSILQLFGSLPQPVIIVTIMSVLIIQVLVMLGYLVWKNRNSPEVRYLFLVVMLPPILLFILSYLMRPIFVPRAFISSGAGIYLLVAWFAGKALLKSRETTPAMAPMLNLAALALVSALVLPNQFAFDGFPRSPFNHTAKELSKQCLAETCLVLHDNKLSYFPMHVYEPGLNQRYLADEPGTFNDTLAVKTQQAIHDLAYPDLESARDGYKRILFVTFEKTLAEYHQMGHAEHPKVVELNRTMRLIETQTYGDLVVFEFSE
jgi:hypothetical protein